MNKPPNQKLDLKQLVVDRAGSGGRQRRRSTATWLTRYLLPLTVLVSFASLFLWSARSSLMPAVSVSVTPVVVSRAKIEQEGLPLFQAAGWIEPRPTPVVASAQAPGVIDRILVVEGQRVEKDEPLAMLIDLDAKLAVAEAKANHQLQEAELLRAEAILHAAELNLKNPLDLRASLADAEALVAKTELEIGNLGFVVQTAKNERDLAEANLVGKRRAGDAISGRALREADAAYFAALGKYNELVARKPRLESQLVSLRERRDALAEKRQLMTDEKRALAIAQANLSAARARVRQMELAVQAADLQLERMVVRSPIDGFVLSLESRPGQRLSGLNPHSAQGSSAVASLYDPNNLQVRVDVRLEDMPQVQVGQSATIRTVAVPEPITGQVLSVTTKADIQKNTLQVKVAIANPPNIIKPEMLAKVTFLAPPSPVVKQELGQSPLRVFVPQSLLMGEESAASIWVADLTRKVAVRKQVGVGRRRAESNLVEITQGLSPTDKLIVNGQQSLVDGKRIRVIQQQPNVFAPVARQASSVESAEQSTGDLN